MPFQFFYYFPACSVFDVYWTEHHALRATTVLFFGGHYWFTCATPLFTTSPLPACFSPNTHGWNRTYYLQAHAVVVVPTLPVTLVRSYGLRLVVVLTIFCLFCFALCFHAPAALPSHHLPPGLSPLFC